MDTGKYAQYSVQDFLADDAFVQWVVQPDDTSNQYWQSVIAAHPGKNQLIEKAAGTLLAYRRQEIFSNETQRAAVWQRIEASVTAQPLAGMRRRTASLQILMRVAAAVILIGGLTFWLFNRTHTDTQLAVATAFGEIKTILLPDQSQVILNGNSSITYAPGWKNNTVREVWIKGEAYFNVVHLNKDSNHIAPGERFIVHVDDLNIEVLGTTFNVKTRHGKTDVALLTGKIRIDYKLPAAGSKALVMAPGDYVEYKASQVIAAKKLTRPAQVSTWTVHELSFSDASLKEIVETLQDSYGYTVGVQDNALLALKIEGDISVDNVADLLEVLSTSLNITISQSADKHITISK
jgi:transmembrane sensor